MNKFIMTVICVLSMCGCDWGISDTDKGVQRYVCLDRGGVSDYRHKMNKVQCLDGSWNDWRYTVIPQDKLKEVYHDAD
jgi:hypothetical protein